MPGLDNLDPQGELVRRILALEAEVRRIGTARREVLPDWTDLPYGTGWTTFSGAFPAAQYLKDSLGFVHLRGLVKRTSGSAMLIGTLPEGYRPSIADVYVVHASTNGSVFQEGRVDIASNGQVTLVLPVTGSLTSSGYVSLANLAFRAEA